MCKSPLVIWNRERSYVRKSRLSDDVDYSTNLDDVLSGEVASSDIRLKSAKFNPSPVVDNHLPFRVVPCGRCVECAKARRSAWYVRARRQIDCGRYKSGFWILWTWKDSTIPKTKEELSASIRRFKDRLRKRFGYTPDHFMVTERGEDDRFTRRLHIHGFLLFREANISFSSVKKCWELEGFSFVRKLGSLPDGRSIAPSVAVTYSMKYMFKSWMYRIEGDVLSGCIYASLGFGLAGFNPQSFRLKLDTDTTYRPTVTFDGRYRYPLPPYLANRVYAFCGAKPEITLEILIQQLVGSPPPGVSLYDHICSVIRDLSLAYSNGLVLSRKVVDIGAVFYCLILYVKTFDYGD